MTLPFEIPNASNAGNVGILSARPRVRRSALLCAAIFAGSLPALVALAESRSAYAGDGVITIESLRDAKWPDTTDC